MPNPFAMTLTGFNPEAIDEAAWAAEAKRLVNDGIIVRRAAAALPQTALGAIFTVSGDVLVKQFWGIVGVAIGAVANATKIVFDPTAGTDVDLCATLDINGKVALTVFSITGIVANAMIGSGLAARGMEVPLILQSGSISVNTAGSSGTGTVAWNCLYVPLSVGASIVAA